MRWDYSEEKHERKGKPTDQTADKTPSSWQSFSQVQQHLESLMELEDGLLQA
jgi:hypothetical protein